MLFASVNLILFASLMISCNKAVIDCWAAFKYLAVRDVVLCMILLTWRYGRKKAQCCADFRNWIDRHLGRKRRVLVCIPCFYLWWLAQDLLRHLAGYIAVYKHLSWTELRNQPACSRSNTTGESCASVCFLFEVNRVYCCCFWWSILLLWFRLVPLIKRHTEAARRVSEEF